MRALADNPDLARITGIDVDRVIRYTWTVSMGLAALAGIMFGLITHLNPNMGWSIILPMFAAAILGGIGNAYGAMAGGMIIGLTQELSTAISARGIQDCSQLADYDCSAALPAQRPDGGKIKCWITWYP